MWVTEVFRAIGSLMGLQGALENVGINSEDCMSVTEGQKKN